MQAFAGEFTLKCQRDQELLAHQSQTLRLHCPFLTQEEDPDGTALADTPRSAAGLAKSMKRVSRLVENEGRKVEQVQSCLDQFWMADDYLHTFGDFARVPSLALSRGNRGFEHRSPNARLRQDLADPCRYIVGLRVNGKDVAKPAFGQLGFDDLDQLPLFGIEPVLRQIPRLGNYELLPLSVFVAALSVNGSKSKRMIRIEQQCVEHLGDDRTIPSVLHQAFFYVL